MCLNLFFVKHILNRKEKKLKLNEYFIIKKTVAGICNRAHAIRNHTIIWHSVWWSKLTNEHGFYNLILLSIVPWIRKNTSLQYSEHRKATNDYDYDTKDKLLQLNGYWRYEMANKYFFCCLASFKKVLCKKIVLDFFLTTFFL